MENSFTPIKAWAENDRPREKLKNLGRKSLSDAELMAILIATGSGKESALDLSRKLLRSVDNDLGKLGRMTIGELQKTKGIGQVKAITIIAALELGQRRKELPKEHRKPVTNSADAYELIRHHLADLPHEEFHVLHFNRANICIAQTKISSGGITGTVVDSRLIFKSAIDHHSTSIILCHNHPSGNLKPSNEDIHLTRKIVEGGKIMDIPVMDHLIVTERGYYSFSDEGMMP